ncbi:MAG: hypothetical protein GX817_05595 [Elusimicrobia bacterium]|nr:hypothetical protein [Elusimicrobiota bacterium]
MIKNKFYFERIITQVLKRAFTLALILCLSFTPLKADSADYLDGLMQYIPADSEFLILGDIAAANEWALAYSSFTEDDILDDVYGRLFENSGIDPVKDIHFLAGFVSLNESYDGGAGAVVVRLDFEKKKFLESLIYERGKLDFPPAKKNELSHMELYDFPLLGEEGELEVWIGFPDKKHLVIGNLEGFELINNLIEKGQGQLTSESPIYEFANLKENYFLSAAIMLNENLFSSDMVEFLADNPIVGALQGIEAIQLTIGFEEESMHLVLNGLRESELENAQLAGMLNGFKGMMMMAAMEAPELAEYMDMINIDYSSDAVTLRVILPEEIFVIEEE